MACPLHAARPPLALTSAPREPGRAARLPAAKAAPAPAAAEAAPKAAAEAAEAACVGERIEVHMYGPHIRRCLVVIRTKPGVWTIPMPMQVTAQLTRHGRR